MINRFISCFTCIIVALCGALFNGCAALLQTHSTVIITQQDSTLLQVNSDYYANNGYTDNKSILSASRFAKIGVSNRVNSYTVTQTKEGYIPYSMPITRSRFNPGKGIDIGICGLSDILALSYASSLSSSGNSSASLPPAIGAPAIYMGTLGWLMIFIGPAKIYEKQYQLPPLIKIPYRTNDENKLYVKSVGVDIKQDSIKAKYYTSFANYKHNAAAIVKHEDKAVKYHNTQFSDTLNRILAGWNYQDTGKNFFSKVYNGAYYVTCDIHDLSVTGVSNYGFLEFTCIWKIFSTTSSKELFSSRTKCSSSWNDLQETQNSFDTYVTDVLKRSMAQFLSTSDVQKYLHDKNAVVSVFDNWPAVNVQPSVKDTVRTLDDAVQAVVTVIVGNGHGSGCIISPDGYMITNYHVIAEDSEKTVRLIDSEGDTLFADYVRSNAQYDLALYKLKKNGPYRYFRVDTVEHEAPIGDDAYAIGTPESIFLGQTLTKGIISGSRKNNNRTIIQTDVSINPGNSGGALVTPTGHLIGIVNAKLAGIGVQGIGFAIPAYYIDDALKIKFNK